MCKASVPSAPPTHTLYSSPSSPPPSRLKVYMAKPDSRLWKSGTKEYWSLTEVFLSQKIESRYIAGAGFVSANTRVDHFDVHKIIIIAF